MTKKVRKYRGNRIYLVYIVLKIRICIGNGYITTAVLREILAALDDKLTPEDLDGIIEEIDEDGSGTIDFDGSLQLRNLRIY